MNEHGAEVRKLYELLADQRGILTVHQLADLLGVSARTVTERYVKRGCRACGWRRTDHRFSCWRTWWCGSVGRTCSARRRDDAGRPFGFAQGRLPGPGPSGGVELRGGTQGCLHRSGVPLAEAALGDGEMDEAEVPCQSGFCSATMRRAVGSLMMRATLRNTALR